MKKCTDCDYHIAPDGCACTQIGRLRPGGEFHAAAPRARANMQSQHYLNDCPCPDCFMTRRWERDGVTRPSELRPGLGFTADYPLPGIALHPSQARR